MIKKVFSFLIYACCLLPAVPAFAQFPILHNYSVKDGLPSSEVYGVMQDSKGYIWSISDLGASRFDGYGFRNFSTENGLPDNTLFASMEDSKKRVWFCSLSGKLSYYFNDSIHVIPCNDTLSKLIKTAISNSVYVDEGDTIWLGIQRNVFYKIKPGWKASDIERITVTHGQYIFLIGKNGLVFGGDGPDKGLISVYNSRLEKLFSIDPGTSNQKRETLRFFAARKNDGSYMASLDRKLLFFTPQGVTYLEEEPSTIISLLEEKDGTVIVATNTGIKVLPAKGTSVQKQVPQLSDKVVTGLCIDHENSLWLATEGQGLYCLPYRNFSYYTTADGLPESKVSAMGHYGKMMVTGHLDGTVSLLNGDTIQAAVTVNEAEPGAKSSRVLTFFNYGERTYAVRNKGIYYFRNNTLVPLPGPFSTIKKIIVHKDSSILALKFKKITRHTPHFRSIIDSIGLEPRVDNMFEGSNGLVWLSAIDGVYTYDGKKITSLSKQDKLFSYRSVDICEDPAHRIWIATRGGGIIIKNGNKLVHLTEKEGLAGNMCRCLFADGNVVWVGTNKGLSKVSIAADGSCSINNLYVSNGLLTNEVNSITRQGDELWLAHSNGITIFDPRHAKSNTSPPPVYITSVLVNDHASGNDDYSKLEYDQDNISISFTGLSFKNAGNTEYIYRMKGVDPGWTYTHYTSIRYLALQPGSYSFAVYARNNDGYWSTVPATVSFTILPPWWQTWTFRISAALFLIALTLVLFKLRLNRIRRIDREKALLHYRLSETELKALRAQMNPHFIYNAINSVQYFITGNDPDSSQKYLAKFAKLIRYVVDNSKPASIPLRTEIDALKLYLELESLRFEEHFAFSINIDENVDVNYLQVPSMIIQPYIENAIWHGLMPKRGKGEIIITMKMEDEILKCTIRDNGIGRKRSEQIKKENGPPIHKSIGMSNTRERLEIINQVNNTNMSVVISDLEDERGEPAGTCVELAIPVY